MLVFCKSEEAYYNERPLIINPFEARLKTGPWGQPTSLKVQCLIKTLASYLILAFFVYGVGFYGNDPHALFPSLRLLQDTSWDFSFFWSEAAEKAVALLLMMPIGLGFVGWSVFLKEIFFPKMENPAAELLGYLMGISLFSIYIFGLAINGILYGPLAALFFAPAVWKGWRQCKVWGHWGTGFWKSPSRALLALPLLLWAAEYLSPPLVWDAVLDHFRYAREVSRLHQIPFYWTNHTGDMPKAAELVLAGFWSLGGESLSKLSGALAAIGAFCLLEVFSREWKGKSIVAEWLFWTGPFFLALFSWGYVEGFLAVYEMAALFCLWKAFTKPKDGIWFSLSCFFLGFSFVIKYTALLAIGAAAALFIYWKWVQRQDLKADWKGLCLFLIPLFPWILKNSLAYGNPFYPLATTFFGASYGYGPGMERELWQDTGFPQGLGLLGRLVLFWKVFFTPGTAVAACWTPLVFMSLPWSWKVFKNKLGIFLLLFTVFFFLGWSVFCTSLRHASGGTLALVVLAAMAWDKAFQEKRGKVSAVFVAGVFLSLWLCLSAQWTATAPYASALGLEDPLLRLKRNYTYDTDTYTAYRFIEAHSDPWDKVIAFAVFQTYPLQRTTFVDFKWKRPIFLQWVSQCRTAEQLAGKLHEEGVKYFLYQRWEAMTMSRLEKDFNLEGMSVQEYRRFWQFFMEPVEMGGNTTVYEVRKAPLEKPRQLDQLPGLQEKGLGQPL